MILSKKIPCQLIDIWQPRWKDRKVLIASHKVGVHNKIIFSKTKSLPGEYYISGLDIRQYPGQSNGKIMCYCVPLDALQKLEYREDLEKEISLEMFT